jgi:hypothetical protein
LESLLTSPGWEIVQDVLKDYEVRSVDALVSYKGSDPSVMKSLQMSARIMKETRNLLNVHIDDAIKASKELLIGEYKNE